MARIPDDELDRLKTEVSLQRLAEGMGITLKRHGADLIGLCPFHDDHDPSLVISPKNNLWHCLGACQAGGSVIDWVMKAEAVSFPHAVQILREMPEALTRSKNIYENPPPGHRSERFLADPFHAEMNDREILNQVVTFYQG